MASEVDHELIVEVSAGTRDMHLAITSLMEEIAAVDWCDGRVDACQDAELKAILARSRDEKRVYASMMLEWLRHRDAGFDQELTGFLAAHGSDLA